jgi:hypothetical protein
MSEHWKPDTNAVPLRPGKARREWTRLQAYWQDEVRSRPLPDGGKAGLILVAAACLGAAIGIYQVLGPREIFAPGAQSDSKSGPAAPAIDGVVGD